MKLKLRRKEEQAQIETQEEQAQIETQEDRGDPVLFHVLVPCFVSRSAFDGWGKMGEKYDSFIKTVRGQSAGGWRDGKNRLADYKNGIHHRHAKP